MRFISLLIRALPRIAFAVLASGLLFSRAALALSGYPDATFGTNGAVKTTMGDFASIMQVVQQPDGKLLAMGLAYAPTNSMAVARYNADGSLDGSFGSAGKFIAPYEYHRGNSIALQGDGKIVIAGDAFDTAETRGIALMRLLPGGTVDGTFGPGTGYVRFDETDLGRSPRLVATPDGKILVAATGSGEDLNVIVVARLLGSGAIDPSFGSSGRTVVSGAGHLSAYNVLQLPDGKVVVGGALNDGTTGGSKLAVVRLNADGAIDGSFGTAGIGLANAQVREGDVRMGLARQPDGKLVVGGSHYGGPSDFTMARFQANGSVDTAFGASGTVTTNLEFADWLYDLIVQPDGRIVAGGSTAVSGTSAKLAAFARYLPNGSLDTSFGSAGKVSFLVGSETFDGFAMCLQRDGRIVLAGNGANDFVLVRIEGGLSASLGPDFDENAKADLLWQHTDGRSAIWLMNGLAMTSGAEIIGAGTGWSVTHLADFNGDGKTDLLWQHTDGRAAIWLMNGLTPIEMKQILNAVDGWTVVHTPDLNGDGKADLVFRNAGAFYAAWIMDGTTMTSGAGLPQPAGFSGWTLTQTADFDGDGKQDFLWVRDNGTVEIWLMDGIARKTQPVQIRASSSGWSPDNVGDLDGDGKADIVWRHSGGAVEAWLMNGTSVANTSVILGGGTGWQVKRLADFDGDGKADLYFDHPDGRAAIWLMNGLTPGTQTQILNAGGGWSMSRTADLNGDARADIVWRHTDGSVAVWLMNGATMSSGAGIVGAGSGWSVSAAK
jgi:uncharacterized delta-60 repeat protein